MAQQNRATGKTNLNTYYPDNNTRLIDADDARGSEDDIWDSHANLIDDKLLFNLRPFQDRPYEVGEWCSYDDGGGVALYQANQAVTGAPFTPAEWDKYDFSAVTASNGLTKVVDDIQLGGLLTALTTIIDGQSVNSLRFNNMLDFLAFCTTAGRFEFNVGGGNDSLFKLQNGEAIYQSSSANTLSISNTNGIDLSSDNTKLDITAGGVSVPMNITSSGTLTADSNDSIVITRAGGNKGIYLDSNQVYIENGATGSAFFINATSTQIVENGEVIVSSNGSGLSEFKNVSTGAIKISTTTGLLSVETVNNKIELDPTTGILITDNGNDGGIRGAADYSANYGANHYVQKAYVDGLIGNTSTAYLQSTGIRSGALLTVNGGDNTKWDLAAGEAFIVDNTDLTSPVYTSIVWTAQTALDVTNLLTDPRTNVAISLNNTPRANISFTNSFLATVNGTPSTTVYIAEKSASDFDAEECRLYACMGRLVHSNLTNLSFTVDLQDHTEALHSSFKDFIKLFPSINGS